MAMDYAATMMQSMPQVSSAYAMSHSDVQNRPRHPYFQYNGEPVFMVPHIPHHRNMSDPIQGQMPHHPKQTEPKPRLAKDEVELLENEFQKNSKPSSQRKREIADLLKVENPRINNWFQNRRAKAKQMLRRELDTRDAPSSESPVDPQEDSSNSDYYGTTSSNSETQRLQASSAAFPLVDQQQQQLSLFPTTTDVSVANSSSPSVEEYPSPESQTLTSAVTQDQAYAPMLSNFLAAANDVNLNNAQMAQDFDTPLGSFVPFTSAMHMESGMVPVSYQSELLSVETPGVLAGFDAHALDQTHPGAFIQQLSSPVSAHSPSSAASDLRFKSPPPPANIANRRSKGAAPAMLNSTALRNYSYGPKTGIDMAKRIDGPSPIRRIASASGIIPNRIQKSSMVPAPRSPLYLERNKEAMMLSLQTASAVNPGPLVRSMSTNVSPVLPMQAPVPLQNAAATILAASSPDAEPQYSFGPTAQQHSFFSPAPPLKTPPVTPGYSGTPVDQLNGEVPWNFAPQDDVLLTPSLGSYGSDEFPMLPSAPAYAVNSQPATPSMAQNYFSLPMQANGLGQADYTFPAEAYLVPGASVRLSPDRPKGKQFQFTPNVTPQDFFASDR